MKTFEEFQKAMETDPKVLEAAKKAFAGIAESNKNARIDAVVKIANEFGYDVSTEDFAKEEAKLAAREGKLDEKEFELVAGGMGHDRKKDQCFLDYLCYTVWNTCHTSNQCFEGLDCHRSIWLCKAEWKNDEDYRKKYCPEAEIEWKPQPA